MRTHGLNVCISRLPDVFTAPLNPSLLQGIDVNSITGTSIAEMRPAAPFNLVTLIFG